MSFTVPYRQVDFVVRHDRLCAHRRRPGQFSSRRCGTRSQSWIPTFRYYGMRTLDQQMDISLVTERLLATLSGAFGLLATLLAAWASTA